MAGRKAGAVGNTNSLQGKLFQMLDCFFKLRLAEKPDMRAADDGMDSFSRQLCDCM